MDQNQNNNQQWQNNNQQWQNNNQQWQNNNQQWQNNNQQYYAPKRQLSFPPRDIAIAIILSIVTCGIYGIIWTIKLVDELNEASATPNATPGLTVFLLSIVTCGIYMYIWLYKSGAVLNTAKANYGFPTEANNGVLYLVLALFGLSIVSFALIQSEMNKISSVYGMKK